jgi:hypothetical protein
MRGHEYSGELIINFFFVLKNYCIRFIKTLLHKINRKKKRNFGLINFKN